MKSQSDKEAIKAELERLFALSGGNLTPNFIVEVARNEDNILHGEFNWDDASAGHAYRIEQARRLVRVVRIEQTINHVTVNAVAYVRNPDLESDEQGYVSTVSLVGDDQRIRSVLMAEFSRAGAALRRAKELALFFGMEGEVDSLADTINAMQIKVQQAEYRV